MDDGHVKYGTNETIPSKGLKRLLEDFNQNCAIVPVQIKNGDNETEIWENFRTIFNCLQQDDNVYFDITHGFRSLPMFVLILNNYSKFLKGISVKSITYGNYEARNAKNEAPIIDLTPLSSLQNWTAAASMFIATGQTKEITSLLQNQGVNSLDEFVQEINECRGLSIFSGSTAANVKAELENVHIEEHTFRELLLKVEQKVSGFGKDDLLNGFRAVEFCIQHNLIQQGITLLQEFLVSYVLKDAGYLDWNDDFDRKTVSGCLSLNHLHRFETPESNDDAKKKSAYELAQKIFALPYKKELTDKVFKGLSLGARNDLNHAGKRIAPKPTGYFENKLNEYYKNTLLILSIKL